MALYYDLFDSFGDLTPVQSSQITYPTGPTVPFNISIPSDLYSGTYTIRVYGDNVAPSYKQVRILGLYDYSNDFYFNTSATQ